MFEDRYLIQILKDHLYGNKTALPENFDSRSLMEYAMIHNMDGIVYYQTKLSVLQSNYAAIIYNSINRERILNELLLALRNNHIEYFVVKGFAIAALYPEPRLRTMGDCDIVVHTEDKEKVHQIILALGGRNTNHGKHEWVYRLKNMDFEIHDKLIYLDERNSEKAIAFFDASWSYVKDDFIEWNFHFVFLLYHLRKHIMGEGAGLRQFMDIAVVMEKVKLDWKKIYIYIEYLDMTVFFNRVLDLLNAWFDFKTLGSITSDKKFLDFATDKILNDGVFGFGDKENQNNIDVFQIQKHGAFYKIKRLLIQTFLPYNKMILIPEYDYLKRKPYLLPFSWVCRICRKWKNKKEVMELRWITDRKMAKRLEYLKEWGL